MGIEGEMQIYIPIWIDLKVFGFGGYTENNF